MEEKTTLVVESPKNLVFVLLYEVLGTAFLIFMFNYLYEDPFMIGIMFFVLYMIGGNISGAHLLYNHVF